MANSSYRLNSSLSDANFKLSCEAIQSKLVPPDKSLVDQILASDNPQKPEIILSDEQKFYWYLAIGSMINPVSLYLRDIVPVISYPTTCIDYKLLFRGPGGMADIEACSGASFDGVVHLLSSDHMAALDRIELGYNRITVNCIDYEGRTHIVYAYQMKSNKYPESFPHERYLDIITKGCEYYKVRPEYTNRLRDEQPVVPRKQPHEFQSFQGFPPDVYYSEEELKRHDGSDPSVPLWISINGKILEYAGLPPPDHADHDSQRFLYSYIKDNLGGREAADAMAKALYEPMFKLPLTSDDICDEHRAQIEDSYCARIAAGEQNSYWKPVGRLRRKKIENVL
ncbi:unnamed protein product [Adineta ricciae]|uniref:gamma-glutamylcyclotransferase n=1 Tax=Adineta ricciae TaxID=249248 RepID=A0A815BWN6_ADIRI|nr:unnamed protein product [Adineta ricciae]